MRLTLSNQVRAQTSMVSLKQLRLCMMSPNPGINSTYPFKDFDFGDLEYKRNNAIQTRDVDCLKPEFGVCAKFIKKCGLVFKYFRLATIFL